MFTHSRKTDIDNCQILTGHDCPGVFTEGASSAALFHPRSLLVQTVTRRSEGFSTKALKERQQTVVASGYWNRAITYWCPGWDQNEGCPWLSPQPGGRPCWPRWRCFHCGTQLFHDVKIYISTTLWSADYCRWGSFSWCCSIIVIPCFKVIARIIFVTRHSECVGFITNCAKYNKSNTIFYNTHKCIWKCWILLNKINR